MKEANIVQSASRVLQEHLPGGWIQRILVQKRAGRFSNDWRRSVNALPYIAVREVLLEARRTVAAVARRALLKDLTLAPEWMHRSLRELAAS